MGVFVLDDYQHVIIIQAFFQSIFPVSFGHKLGKGRLENKGRYKGWRKNHKWCGENDHELDVPIFYGR